MEKIIHLMIKAYILILTYVGNLKSVLNELKNLENVESIAVIAGDYDIIVKAKVENLEQLMELTDKIHAIKGVKRTNTQVVEKEIET
jgi:DNA-binding Lrp family transcriptional regulator